MINVSNPRKILANLAVAALACASRALAAPQWSSSLPKALEAAKADGRPVLVDFQAPWCYSCYFMEGHVLNQPSFARAAERLALVKVDVDQAEGRSLKEKYKVTFLPTYVLVDAKGEPLGRIVGEQTEGDFVAKLGEITGKGASAPEAAAMAALRARLAADEFETAVQDLEALDRELVKKLAGRKEWRILKARLSLMKAAKGAGKDVGPALASFKELLALEDSCELAYDAFFAGRLIDGMEEPRRKAWLQEQRQPLERLVNEKAMKGACADFRTPVETLGEVYAGLGLEPEALALYARAVERLEKAPVKVGEDRNRDDNLRFFLELEKADGRLRSFYEELASAYSLDYVYPYRYAKYLLERKRAEEALPWIEKADKLCYGANRYAVTKIRARVLAALGRVTEARAILDRDARVSGKSFAKEAAELRGMLEDLSR
jgi:thiol-disulfide isomerase/thioredoxin